jgi:hypothetical protein
MPDSLVYRLKFRRGDYEIEVQGDKEYVDKKFQELLDAQFPSKTIQPLSTPSKQVQGDGLRPLSLREYVDQFNTKAHMDYVLLIAYYLEKFRSQESFTATDIRNAYAEMREKLTNAGPFILQNVKKGFLMESPSKEGAKKATYSLTRKGMQFIENGLSIPE